MYDHAAIRLLIDDLRVHGFSVGLVEEQRIVELLFRLHYARAVPSTAQLCRMLSAVLCCTADQQNQFSARFEAYFSGFERHALPPLPPPPAPPPPSSSSALPNVWGFWRALSLQDRHEIARRVRIMLTAVIILLLAISLIGYLFPPPNPSPGVSSPVDGVHEHAMDQQIQEQAAALRAQASTLGQKASGSLNRALAGPRAAWQGFGSVLGPFTFFALTAPFLFGGLWVVAPGRRQAAYISRRDVKARPKFTDLFVSSRPVDILGHHASARMLQPLRRPQMAISAEIDVDASIPRMLANDGLFEPVFQLRPMPPEYLILIDRRGPGDHVALCGEALVHALRVANVYIDAYWFDRDPRRLFRTAESMALSLDDVAGRHSDHRLILIASGERLLDVSNGGLQPWAHVFRQFERRIMLTPAAPELWGYRERALFEALRFSILPLSTASIGQLVEILGAEEPPLPNPPLPPRADKTSPKVALADLMEERTLRWMLASPPTSEEQDELILALRDGLSDVQWRWLSACAVYPQLVWQLTLFLAAPLRNQAHDPRPLFDELIALGQLPWFRTGELPLWLRERLTRLMDDEEYRIVMRSLSQLLQTTLQPQGSSTALVVGDDRSKRDDRTKRHGVPPLLKDEVLIEFLSCPPSERTVVPLSDELAARFSRIPETKSWLRPLFSNRRMQEIRLDAKLTDSVLSEEGATVVEVSSPGDVSDPGPDYRLVTSLMTKAGDTVPAGGLMVYLPAGKRVGRIVNDWTADLHRRNRKLATRLGLCNLALVIVSLLIFYNNPERSGTNVGLDVMLAIAWITIPFLALYAGLVFPVTRCLRDFPTAVPVGAVPPHIARTFTVGR